MKFIILMALFISSSYAASKRIECNSSEHKVIITVDAQNNLSVFFKGESVRADGLVDENEIDLVARFKSVGEMTLFAKIAKEAPGNYLFIQSQRFPVFCR